MESTNTEDDEPHSQNLPLPNLIDDNAKYEGEFQVFERHRAETALAGRHFFSPNVDVDKQRRYCHKSPLRRGGVTLKDNSSRSLFP